MLPFVIDRPIPCGPNTQEEDKSSAPDSLLHSVFPLLLVPTAASGQLVPQARLQWGWGGEDRSLRMTYSQKGASRIQSDPPPCKASTASKLALPGLSVSHACLSVSPDCCHLDPEMPNPRRCAQGGEIYHVCLTFDQEPPCSPFPVFHVTSDRS